MSARARHRSMRVLMTVDAVGGVWRYAMDLAAVLQPKGIETVFAGFGPPPSAEQAREAEAIGKLAWCAAPLDWMAEDEAELAPVPDMISELAFREDADLLHLNLPSQAAGLTIDIPAVVVSHSCVATWFRMVRGRDVPDDWAWQTRLNRQGFQHAKAVFAPSRSHAALLRGVYGPIDGLEIVLNASQAPASSARKKPFVFAAGRWWDDGKNGAVLDAAASDVEWPVVLAGANRGPSGQYLPLQNTIHRGALAHSETMALMSEAAIVACPSLYEPFGLAALEAARCASALVLADMPTFRELWDGAALFADPHDPQAFAQAINGLAKDEALRHRLGEQAQARSLDFTSEAQADAVMRVYRRLLSAQALTAAE